VRVVWGVAIMSQAANVYLVTMGGVDPGDVAPIVYEGTTGVTDPLVQALVLTAIVISFGTTAFALALTMRVYQEHGTIEMDEVGRSGREGVGQVGPADGQEGPVDGQEGPAAADGGAVPEDRGGETDG
jgi:multicomponent Na+:H+ antiporter subunit C